MTGSFHLDTLPATAASQREVPKGPRRLSHESLPVLNPVTNLDFDVTENCNLGCLYCFKGEMYSRHMSLDTMKASLEWLLRASGLATSVNCNFMGGEPTMRWRQIREFVPWARRRGRSVGKQVTFSMTTNLTLFTEEMREFVDRYGFGILMSIDGSPDVQDGQRPAKNGKKMSEVVEYWARSLLRTRPRSTARVTVHPDYVHRMEDGVRYLHNLGFREIAISGSEYDKWTETHYKTLRSQLGLIGNYVSTVITSGGDLILTAFKYHIEKLVHLRSEARDGEIEFRKHPCGAGRGYMMIDYTGDIWPCHRFDGADTAAKAGGQFRFGNIFGNGFKHDLQKAFMSFDDSKIHKPSCPTCPVNPVCGGYCPAANLSEKGSIYTPHDTYCTWAQTMYAEADRLYHELKRDNLDAFTRLLEMCQGAADDGQK